MKAAHEGALVAKPMALVVAIYTLPLFPGDASSFPHRVLQNPVIRVEVQMPDGEKGFSRGPRFDPAGMVTRVDFGGHRFFAAFNDPHDPRAPDGCGGLAEEFKWPVGFDEAGTNGVFVKMGVGELRRDPFPYYFNKPYPVVRFTPWDVESTGNAMVFRQSWSNGGWGWRYEKRLSISERAPHLTLAHRLVNTGSRFLSNQHYNHHILTIDGMPIGPGYEVSFPFHAFGKIQAAGLWGPWGDTWKFLRPADLPTLTAVARVHWIPHPMSLVVHERTRAAGVTIGIDFPLSDFPIFTAPRALSPEPIVAIRVPPGGSQEWTLTYTFHAGEPPTFDPSKMDDRAFHGLGAVTLGGEPWRDFDGDTHAYKRVVPGRAGDRAPAFGAEPLNAKDRVEILQAATLPGTARITLKPYDPRLPPEDYEIHLRDSGGVRVEASTNGQDGYKTLDGELETGWSAEGRQVNLTWLFDAPRKLEGVALAWLKGNERRALFKLQGTLDGKAWFDLFDGESSGTNRSMEKILFKSTTRMTALRLEGRGNSVSAWNSPREIQFLEKNLGK